MLKFYLQSLGRRYTVDNGDQYTFHFTLDGAERQAKSNGGIVTDLKDGSEFVEHMDEEATESV